MNAAVWILSVFTNLLGKRSIDLMCERAVDDAAWRAEELASPPDNHDHAERPE